MAATSDNYITIHSSFTNRGTKKGKVLIVQRHGQAEKNVKLRPQRLALVENLKKILSNHNSNILSSLANSSSIEAEGNLILENWATLSNDEKWFDDCLNDQGIKQVQEAGLEMLSWLRKENCVELPHLFLTSPFRRAWQTQLISSNLAGCGAIGGGNKKKWIAHDGLSETPYSESSCRRFSKTEIQRWQPCLDVSMLMEECQNLPYTHLQITWALLRVRSSLKPFEGKVEKSSITTTEVEDGVTLPQNKKAKSLMDVELGGKGSCSTTTLEGEKRSEREANEDAILYQAYDEEADESVSNPIDDMVKQRVHEFLDWLKKQDETTVWIATHQGPVRRILEGVIGVEEVAAQGARYSKPANAQIIVVFLPCD